MTLVLFIAGIVLMLHGFPIFGFICVIGALLH